METSLFTRGLTLSVNNYFSSSLSQIVTLIDDVNEY